VTYIPDCDPIPNNLNCVLSGFNECSLTEHVEVTSAEQQLKWRQLSSETRAAQQRLDNARILVGRLGASAQSLEGMGLA